MWCNPHHLVLFCYVARHGGIAAALPNIPFGISQPALSNQILALERELGVVLFKRKPFALTAAGKHLFAHVEPCFARLDAVVGELRMVAAPHLRIGASEVVLCHYMPAISEELRRREPALRFTFRSGTSSELLRLVAAGELDLVITAIDQPPVGLRSQLLVELPLVLVAPRDLPVRVDALLDPAQSKPPLICPGGSETICRRFDAELKARNLAWYPETHVSSIALVTWFVAAGHGVGLTVDIPPLVQKSKVRRIALPGFGAVPVAALWRDQPSRHLEALLAVLERHSTKAEAQNL